MSDDRRRQLVQQVITDVGGAFVSGLGYIGDRLGLFRLLTDRGPLSSAALADAAGLHERYVREWLKAMVSAGYAEHDQARDVYAMTADQAAVLADEGSPVFAAGAFQFALPSLAFTDRLIDCFRHGGGIPYAALGAEIPDAIGRMHRAWFDYQLTGSWLPAAPDVEGRLRHGIGVLDVGCGTGRASVAVGRTYPASQVVGIDPHVPSIDAARALAAEAGVTNVSFREVGLEELAASERFDLILAIDCIHDMRDPVGALRIIHGALTAQGVVFWSEPSGSDDPAENRNPPGRMRSALSPYHCLTISLAEGGAGLGTIIGEAGARALASEAGFERFERLEVPSPMQQFFLLYR